MRQRVAVARTWAADPDVILMDEPFAAVDAMTRLTLQEELVRLCAATAKTVFFITHSVDEAVFLADRVLVMTRRPGRIKAAIDVPGRSGGRDWESFKVDKAMQQASSSRKPRPACAGAGRHARRPPRDRRPKASAHERDDRGIGADAAFSSGSSLRLWGGSCGLRSCCPSSR